MRTRLWISEPDKFHGNYVVQFYSEDKDLWRKAYVLLRKTFFLSASRDISFRPFEQGKTNGEWYYIEFFTHPDLIYEIMEIVENEICPELGIKLEIGEITNE